MTVRRLFLVPILFACAHSAPRPAEPAVTTLGIDESSIDPTVSPCDDFYQYACGNWIKRAEIPGDRSSWDGFNSIEERNQAELRKILDEAAAGQAKGPYMDKVGALYASCMDEAAIEQNAPGELKAQLARIDAIRDVAGLEKEVARLHLSVGNPMFSFGQEQDFKNATEVIGVLDQGGLGLPDRDYYLASTGNFPELRKQYEAHVARMLVLAGEPEAQAQKDAATIIKLETALAQASMPRVDRRDPNKVYHRIDLAGIEKAAPSWPWKQYLADEGVPGLTAINVRNPEFFAALSRLLSEALLDDWKAYLRWHVVHDTAPALSKAFVDENFAFYDKALSGTAEIEPRWKRCAEALDGLMGEALGRAFVDKTFGSEGKESTRATVKEIEVAMGADLDSLSWFDDATRNQAHAKLAAIGNKIGYPDKWRNYDALEVKRGDSYLVNSLRAGEFETRRQLAKIGKPVDKGEWFMTPPTVNAYYSASKNEIVFPAGILQPPFYTRGAPKAVNYGSIGMVMGHELTHGFDDSGRRFDAGGNLRDWWSPSIGDEFVRRAACVSNQFDGYVSIDDLHVNGKLTLGENIADLGGLKLAHAAYVKARDGGPRQIGKFTDEQLFFLGAAQAWCTKRRPENARMRVTVDPHSPPQWRINGPMSNLPEFSAAFQCKAGDRMVRANRCVVW